MENPQQPRTSLTLILHTQLLTLTDMTYIQSVTGKSGGEYGLDVFLQSTRFSKRNTSAKTAGWICEWQPTPNKGRVQVRWRLLYVRSRHYPSVQRLSQLLHWMICKMGADVECLLSVVLTTLQILFTGFYKTEWWWNQTAGKQLVFLIVSGPWDHFFYYIFSSGKCVILTSSTHV